MEGSAHARADAESVDFDAESSALTSASRGSSSSDGSERASAGVALLGARHDLGLAATEPTCQCLAALQGQPSTSAFVWSGTPPNTDPAQQLVVAFASQGVACSRPHLEASYRGYELIGADVVISIEGAEPGRPITRGAIVPRPQKGGRVLLQSSKDLPYGTSLGGGRPCELK